MRPVPADQRNIEARVRALGDLWKPLLRDRGRFDLSTFV